MGLTRILVRFNLLNLLIVCVCSIYCRAKFIKSQPPTETSQMIIPFLFFSSFIRSIQLYEFACDFITKFLHFQPPIQHWILFIAVAALLQNWTNWQSYTHSFFCRGFVLKQNCIRKIYTVQRNEFVLLDDDYIVLKRFKNENTRSKSSRGSSKQYSR